MNLEYTQRILRQKATNTSSCSCWLYNYTSDTSGMGNIFFSAIAIILYCTVEDLPLVVFNP